MAKSNVEMDRLMSTEEWGWDYDGDTCSRTAARASVDGPEGVAKAKVHGDDEDLAAAVAPASDRGAGGGARSVGPYVTVLTRLLRPELLPTKADLLVGVPRGRVSVMPPRDIGARSDSDDLCADHQTAAELRRGGVESAGEGPLLGPNDDDLRMTRAGEPQWSVSSSSGGEGSSGQGALSLQTATAGESTARIFSWPWRMSGLLPSRLL